jgi:hypothetical protein
LHKLQSIHGFYVSFLSAQSSRPFSHTNSPSQVANLSQCLGLSIDSKSHTLTIYRNSTRKYAQKRQISRPARSVHKFTRLIFLQTQSSTVTERFTRHQATNTSTKYNNSKTRTQIAQPQFLLQEARLHAQVFCIRNYPVLHLWERKMREGEELKGKKRGGLGESQRVPIIATPCSRLRIPNLFLHFLFLSGTFTLTFILPFCPFLLVCHYLLKYLFTFWILKCTLDYFNTKYSKYI